MADNQLTGFASAFDALLERNRRRLQEKFPASAGIRTSGSRPREGIARSAALPERVFPDPSTTQRGVSTPPVERAGAPARLTEAPESEGMRRLNERFGDGWQYELTERRREGNEVIVLCRVTVPEKGLSKEQFGRARVRAAGQVDTIRGKAGGVSFSMRLEPHKSLSPPANPEETAFQEAVQNALTRCAELM